MGELPALVGDVGGTNCRFALAASSPDSGWTLSQIRVYRGDAFPAFEDAVRTYFDETGASVSRAAIAVAGPVEDGSVRMTNRAWRIDAGRLATVFGLADCRLINDFEALAHALPALGPDDVRPLGPVRLAPSSRTMAVLGAGTGLGAAALVRAGAAEAVVVSEAGHVAFSPQDELEREVRTWIARDRDFVAVEHLLSGPGLLNLHRSLSEAAGGKPKFETPEAITAGVGAGDSDARTVADLFVRIFGSVAGDLALAFGARGGVFVAGGVSLRLLSADNAAVFRARFEAKGDFTPYVAAIPTALIVRPDPGLLGAACALGKAR